MLRLICEAVIGICDQQQAALWGAQGYHVLPWHCCHSAYVCRSRLQLLGFGLASSLHLVDMQPACSAMCILGDKSEAYSSGKLRPSTLPGLQMVHSSEPASTEDTQDAAAQACWSAAMGMHSAPAESAKQQAAVTAMAVMSWLWACSWHTTACCGWPGLSDLNCRHQICSTVAASAQPGRTIVA